VHRYAFLAAFALVTTAAAACGARTMLFGADEDTVEDAGAREIDAPNQGHAENPPTQLAGDASTADANVALEGGLVSLPSCVVQAEGTARCGAIGESCCASGVIEGGTFYRTYLNDGGGATQTADPATVSSFRLDKYLVTVGRFRQFVIAWSGGAGWKPAPGSGKHTHLNGGKGLVNVGMGGGYEPGWVTSYDGQLAMTDTNLAVDVPPGIVSPSYATWTAAPGARETDPIDNVNWYEAYAFCIWDGGFLPSEAEWGYAAAGGDELRQYPWGTAQPGLTSQYAIYGCSYPTGTSHCEGVANIAPVGTAALGVARGGQLDLGGNVGEWALDGWADYVSPCIDCTNTGPVDGDARVWRGGTFLTMDLGSLPTARSWAPPNFRHDAEFVGFRCARPP
jgi:formylglycine-generating enzyme required for sulfatase activity